MTRSGTANAWLSYVEPKPWANLRLFCFPYAGGGAAVYRGWADRMPGAIEVCPVQPPGRETRFGEPAFTRLGPLVAAATEGLRPYLDRPFALFGHSMGALVAFELARKWRRDFGLAPVHLFVSGCSAPQLDDTDSRCHTLPDPEFLEELRRLNGTPRTLLENPDLMQLLLPTLKADFAVCETYEYIEQPPLYCPISALGGLQDPTTGRNQLDAWRHQTTAAFRLRLFPGDHFFLQTASPLLTQTLVQELHHGGDLRHGAWTKTEVHARPASAVTAAVT